MKAGGLLNGGVDGGAGTAPVDFSGQPEEEEVPNVTPEEQQQYDLFVENAMEIMYTEDGKPQPEVLAKLSTGSKPIDALAQTAVWVVMMVEADASRMGMSIDDDVIMHAGREIMEQLVELAEAAGLHEYKEAELQGAWYSALDMYREANSDEGGRVNPEEASAEFEALNEADKEGRGDEVLPGFEQMSEKAVASAMADQNPVETEEDETKVLNRKDVGRG